LSATCAALLIKYFYLINYFHSIDLVQEDTPSHLQKTSENMIKLDINGLTPNTDTSPDMALLSSLRKAMVVFASSQSEAKQLMTYWVGRILWWN
jgi:hypothetical protein